jgi:hypothetical protein
MQYRTNWLIKIKDFSLSVARLIRDEFCLLGCDTRSPLKVNRCFGGTFRLHFQGWRISQREAGSGQSFWALPIVSAYSNRCVSNVGTLFVFGWTGFIYSTSDFFFFFPLALQPNSVLGRLHETFRFTSVTTSRTVGRTPWTGDQLVVRPLPVHKQKNAHTTQTLNIHSNPRSRRPRERRQFMP